MAVSIVNLEEVGEVKIYRRRGQKNIRLRVDNDGSIKLSLPWYVSKKVGLMYAISKKAWLAEQLESHAGSLAEVKYIGIYKVEIVHTDRRRPSARIEDDSIVIDLPGHFSDDIKIKKAVNVIEEVLRKKAEKELAPKLREIADENQIQIKSIRVKKLKSRWGSCDSKKNITLNLYLSQVPNSVWEYVLCHELAHTKHLNHGRQFWNYVKELNPDYAKHRKELRKFSPGKLNVR